MDWMEELRRAANESLPGWLAHYIECGAMAGVSAAGASAAWDRLRLRPRVLVDVAAVSTSTTVLGQEVSSPLAVAPTALHRALHPEGELATATAAAEAGALFCLSARSGMRMEKIAATGVRWWMQVYVLRDRDVTEAYVRRAAAAGAGALVLTADTPVLGRKPGADALAEQAGVDLPAAYSAANVTPVGEDPETYWNSESVRDLYQAPDLTPAAIGWLAELSGLPVVVKGVLRADDARRCVDGGAAAIWVSNHGGRQLDGAVSTADALPEVVAALDGTGAEVYVDGGIRRGSHALRALALGARMVFLGRPPLWGLACAGADGVRQVLDGLTDELAHAMTLSGAPTPAHLTPDLVAPEPAG
ncbi:MAG TPA: alpha-hydroxy acid oxidase [Cryptosporangiaceae bacterium]|nr:alpha-hydroxy acid oxidase [Cryptosporangiaceae bacterium]